MRVFKNIGLWIGTSSIERLTHIAEHSALSNLVEKITFLPLRLVEDNLTSDKHRREVLDWFRWGHAFALNDFATDYDNYLKAYVEFIRCQRLLYAEDTAIKLLADSFRRLQNLKEFQVCPCLPNPDHPLPNQLVR